jgi:dihydrodipicolinate synthase/N-acetylneuraminate lyase
MFYESRRRIMKKEDQSDVGIRGETGELYMLNKKERILTIEVLKRILATADGREFVVGRFGEDGLKVATTLLAQMGVQISKQQGQKTSS